MARRTKTFIEMEGVEAIHRALAQLKLSALRDVIRVVAASAAVIERDAKAACPVSEPATKGAKAAPSGTTRSSIRTILRDGGLTASIGSGWFVARFIEQGVNGRPARPFLNPAFQHARPAYLAGIEAAVGKAGKEASIK